MSTVGSKDGTVIAFDRLGQGAPVILVDGALCSRVFGSLPELAKLLATRFSVYHYDRRGRNQSGDQPPYAVEREVEDIEALIAEAGEPASVFGISSGAALALAAAAEGASIKKLALYEPPFIAGGARRVPADSEAQLKRRIAEGRRGDAVQFFLVDMVGLPAIVGYLMRVAPVWPKLKAAAHTLPYDAAVLGDFSLPRERAAAVAVPTLLIGGEKSSVELRATARATAEAVPGAQLRMLQGQTHNPSAKVVAPVLAEFFSG